jgi:ribA/ribD-fused uncharacterized protein
MSEQLKQFRDPQLAIPLDGEPIEVVGFYPREFFPCDNFSSFRVKYCGVVWPTNEHLYQASHFFDTDPYLVEEILHAPSAHDAYKIGKANAHRAPENWDDMKVDVMYELCKMKLEQHPYVQKKLLETGGLEIVEDSPKDTFWGWGPDHSGQNQLGKIWMRLRDELRSSLITVNDM